MSLDNIQLPPTILQSLYSKSLYDLKTNELEPGDIKAAKIAYLGNNQKKIALLVTSSSAIYLPDEELNFLMGILTACKLSMADVALINLNKNADLTYTQISEQLKAEKVFLFGLDADALQLPLQFPHYQIQQYNNQVYLTSLSLPELQNDKAEKMKLWNCLKSIFSL
jgi:hypothetical protein